MILSREIQRHALEHGADTALEWLEGDKAEPVRRLSYAELHRQSRALARSLAALHLRGERVLLPFPPGLDFVVAFVACLDAGAVPVPTPFPQNRRTLARTRAILADSRPALCLAPEIWINSLRERLAPAEADATRAHCPCAAFETLLASGLAARSDLAVAAADDSSENDGLPTPAPDQLAYLQYTSGTGGTAKGVMISHANLAHNVTVLDTAGRQSRALPFLSWLPHYHDMQLVVILARSLMIGAPCVLMSPVDFLQRPLRWLRALGRTGAYISGGPNFAYEHCLRRVSAADVAGLDLSRWKIAFNSSETVRPATLRRFEELLVATGFTARAWFPAYGLAEATAFVTGVAVDEVPVERPNPESGQPLVSAGRPLLGDEVAIVDPANGTLCPPGRIGEICAAGGSITRGYWQRPEATAALFYERLPLSPAHEHATPRPFLRTGDLGFLDAEGRLFFTGRSKDLIVIRGINHHPEDIEASLDGCHPALRSGEVAVFSVEDAAEAREQLVVVAELGRTHRLNPEVAAIAEAAQIVVSREHDLALDHLVLLPPGALPKTTSGKVQRGACRRLFTAGEFSPVAEWHRQPFAPRAAMPPRSFSA